MRLVGNIIGAVIGIGALIIIGLLVILAVLWIAGMIAQQLQPLP